MDQEAEKLKLIGQLENAIKDGDPSEDRIAEIANVLFVIDQSMQDNKWQMTPSATLVINKSAEFLFDSEIRSLIKMNKYPALRQFLFALAGKNLTNLDDLLIEMIVNPKNLKDEIKIPDNLIRKLMADYETRGALMKLSNGRSLSEALRSLSTSYSTLAQLRSVAWRTIKGQLEKTSENYSVTVEERRFVQELWSSESALRHSIFMHHLPLELADDLERWKVTALIDLSYENFQELCRDLTKHEKTVFEKLYRKESSFSATRTQTEKILKQTLCEKIARAKEMAGSIVDGNETEANLQQLESLFLNWNGQTSEQSSNSPVNLAGINQALNSAEDTLNMLENPFENDEDFIATIDGGLALHGLSYGLDADVLCGLAPQPFFRKPQICVVKETSAETQKWEEHFFSSEQATNFKKVIAQVGYSFGCNLKARGYGFKAEANFKQGTHQQRCQSSSDAEFTNKLTMISVHTYPMASYRIDRDQLALSMSALRSLESVTDMTAAETFLEQYGSHFSTGLHQLGGTLCHSIELVAQREQSSTSLKELAKKEMNAAVSLEYASLFQVGGRVKELDTSQASSATSHQASKISSRSEITARGPTALHPRLFQELVRINSRSWHVIDRGVTQQSLHPIWNLIAEKHSNFKLAADLLRKAWLRRTAQIDNMDIIQAERQRIEKKQLTSQNDEKQEKIVAILHTLKEVDVETVEEGFLLEQFTAFFQALFYIDYNSSSSTNEESPWVTYVAKQEQFCHLLMKLARYQQKMQSEQKFQRVFRYLSGAIDSKQLEKMDHAGYRLSDEIEIMLSRYSQESLDKAAVASNASAFQAKLSTVAISNLVDILREELQSNENDLQWKIQTILAAVLRTKPIGRARQLRDAIEDLLVKDYNWQNDSFGEDIPLSIQGLAQLVEQIHQLEERIHQLENHNLKELPINPAAADSSSDDESEEYLSANETNEDCCSSFPVVAFEQLGENDRPRAAQTNDSNSETPIIYSEDAIKVLLVKDCNLQNDSFGEGIPLSTQGHAQLVERIHQLENQKLEELSIIPAAVNSSSDDNIDGAKAYLNKTETNDDCCPPFAIEAIEQIDRTCAAKTTGSNSETPIIYSEDVWQQFAKQSNNFKKKPFADVLIDRPLNSIDAREKPTDYLMSCLRFRKRLNMGADDEAAENGPSLYDTLLRLCDEFDDSGKGEIFRLLLERRSAVPLFLPCLNGSQLALLRDTAGNLTTNLGEDKSLRRIVLVSCRKTNESQMPEILKKLFHVESLHRLDFSINRATEWPMSAEIAIGCVAVDVEPGTSPSSVQHLLVLHVVGNFRPLWSFIEQFADHLMIEDSLDSLFSYRSVVMQLDNQPSLGAEAKLDAFSSVSVWKQTCGKMDVVKSDATGRRFCIDGPFGDKVGERLKKNLLLAFSETGSAQKSLKSPNRLSLYEMQSLIPQYMRAVEYSTPWDIQAVVNTTSLSDVRVNQLILQINYRQQAVHEELKCKYRLDDDRKKKEEETIKSFVNQRKNQLEELKKNPPGLLVLLQRLLKMEDSCARVLAMRKLERSIALRSEQELGSQWEKIDKLYSMYAKQRAENNEELMAKTNQELQIARVQFNESVLSIEHLWRELSHMYVAAPTTFKHLPKFAARHLMDGFSIELLDGDSNLVNLQWIQQVLVELGQFMEKKKQRIFVLSIMGVQSSGKSTLLNIMFGIQMRTSVGQCTRGVNMQLLKVEGRREYDYVLVLDTEGTRSPEYHGFEGSEKRDNQMATLSILLADATIIVNPGENDAAIKEILPIVLMAYQGSKLAEDNGGRLSNMMFFVYNRIDTTQKDKLSNIIQTLAKSLNEAFDAVKKLDGIVSVHLNEESPLRNFRLDASNSSQSDVRILGNVKEKFAPPGDVPDVAYGESLAELREHIHQRVTQARGRTDWTSRSLIQFSNSLVQVWNCIGSADFTLHFASLVERSNFDQLDAEYKTCEQRLASQYQKTFSAVQKDMVARKDENDVLKISDFEGIMSEQVNLAEIELDQEVEKFVSEKGREKWQLKYRELWNEYKENQNQHWKRLLNSSFHTLFDYDKQVEKLKMDMRQQIRQLFSSPTAGEWNQQKKDKEFNKMYGKYLDTAEAQYPPINVEDKIKKVYQNNPSIQLRKIEMRKDDDSVKDIETECEFIIENQRVRVTANELYPAGGNAENEESNIFKKGLKYVKKGLKSIKWYGGDSPTNFKPTDYQKEIYANVRRILIGKICYDDSICYDVIKTTEKIMTQANRNFQNIDYQKAHIYAQKLTIILLVDVQNEWEQRNSVYAKLGQESNRVAMRQYFMVASQGVETTKLFICLLESTLKNNLAEAFENVMIQLVTNRVRNEKWLHNGKFMQNHLDLYLIDLLEDQKLSVVLFFMLRPTILYHIVLQSLIAKQIPEVKNEHAKFVGALKTQIKLTISTSASVNRGRAALIIKTLRDACVNTLQAQFLGQKLMIDCGDEYKDCDNEEEFAFNKSCTDALLAVVDEFTPPTASENYVNSLSSKVVEFMKNQNDPVALPRCDVPCPWCNSLCMETANHNTKLKPHDTIHQPSGLSGTKEQMTRILSHTACSKYEDYVCLFHGEKFLGIFKDFETIFPGWMKPKFKENWPLREFIIANYHEDIAKMYGAEPCSEIPPEYNRELDCIRDDIKRQVEYAED